MVLDAMVDCAYNAWEGYTRLQETHPKFGAMVTGEIIYPLADVISQLGEKRTLNLKKVDWRKVGYKAALSWLYGLGIYALLKSSEIPPSTTVAPVVDPITGPDLRKAIFGPNFYAQVFNSFFFVNEAVGDIKNHSITELVKHYRDLFKGEDDHERSLKDYWTNFKKNYVDNFWNKKFAITTGIVLTVNNGVVGAIYKWIPEDMETPATLGYILLFAILMTALASKKGKEDLTGLEAIT